MKVVLWHYLPAENWNGQMATDLFNGPVINALRRSCGENDSYSLLEDNDPTGYKSNKAMEAKAALNIKPWKFPRYSPDLNPLDFFLWHEVERRMAERKSVRNESVESYKRRLRSVAMRIPSALIKKAVSGMKERATAIWQAGGGDIARD